MAKQQLSRYEKRSRSAAKHLRNPDAEKRAKAARLIGELAHADEQVIRQLIHMEANDEDAGVRAAAAYSLGMFKAVLEVINGDDKDAAEDAGAAVKNVTDTGEIGKTAPIPAKTLQMVLISLSVLLIVLMIANGVIFATTERTPRPPRIVGVSPEQVAQVTLLETRIQALSDNANILELKLSPAVAGGQPNPDTECPFPYAPLAPLGVTDGALVQMATELDATLVQFDAINARTESACSGAQPFTVDEASGFMAEIATFRANEAARRDALLMAKTPPTLTPIPGTATPIPTATEPPDLRAIIAELYNIRDQVTGLRGASTILNQYWIEAQNNSGKTGGCTAAAIDIPPNYVLPPGVAEYSPEVAQATTLINGGLQTVRDGWTEFYAACEQGDIAVLNASGTGATVSTTAQDAFDAADLLLQQVLAN